MQTLKKIVTNKYLIGLVVFLGAVFGLSFLLPDIARDLARYFAYMSICCNTLPLPTTPLIIYMGGEYGDVVQYGGRDWGWVIIALIGALGTSLANLIDYEILGTVMQTRLAQKITGSKHYQASLRAFNKYAFLALTAVNFIAFSIDVVRFIAISARYPRWKYVISTFIGRFARYALLAVFGQIFKVPLWGILVIVVVLALPGLISWLREKLKKDGSGGEAETPATADAESPE
ncbi:MAG: VTT domain-containing protein [bacterium]|nr:VTT domain-containing protein [bacterium]